MNSEENCFGLCFNILVDSSVPDPFMPMGARRQRFACKWGKRELRKTGELLCSSHQSHPLLSSLSLSSQSHSDLERVHLWVIDHTFQSRVTFRLETPMDANFVGWADLGGEAWRLTGGHYGRQRPLSSSARGPWKLLHCYPRMMDRGSVITHQPNFNNSKCRPWQWSLWSKGTSNVMRDTFNV